MSSLFNTVQIKTQQQSTHMKNNLTLKYGRPTAYYNNQFSQSKLTMSKLSSIGAVSYKRKLPDSCSDGFTKEFPARIQHLPNPAELPVKTDPFIRARAFLHECIKKIKEVRKRKTGRQKYKV
jgi:hypothetical protein